MEMSQIVYIWRGNSGFKPETRLQLHDELYNPGEAESAHWMMCRVYLSLLECGQGALAPKTMQSMYIG